MVKDILIVTTIAGFLIYGLSLRHLMRNNGADFDIYRVADRGIWSIMCLSFFAGIFSGASLLVDAMGYGLIV